MKLEYSSLLVLVALAGVPGLGAVGLAASDAGASAQGPSVARGVDPGQAPTRLRDLGGVPGERVMARGTTVSAQAGLLGAVDDAAEAARHVETVNRWAAAFPAPGHDVWASWVRAVREGFAPGGGDHALLEAERFMPKEVGESFTFLLRDIPEQRFGRILERSTRWEASEVGPPWPSHLHRAYGALERVGNRVRALLGESFGVTIPGKSGAELRVSSVPTPSRSPHTDGLALTLTGTFLGEGTELLGAGVNATRGQLALIAGKQFEEVAAAGLIPGYEHVRALKHQEGLHPAVGPRAVLLIRPPHIVTDDTAQVYRMRDAHLRATPPRRP